MGFNSVYQCLTDVFPKVDSRLLRAVAIEHSKDADAAVEVVLSEIIPYLSKQSMPPSSTPKELRPGVGSSSTSKDKRPIVASSSTLKDQSPKEFSDGEADHEDQSSLLRHRLGIKISASSSGAKSSSIAGEDARSTDITRGTQLADSEALNISTVSNYYDANDGNNQLSGNIETEELILLGKASMEAGSSQISDVMSNMHENTYHSTESKESKVVEQEWKDFDGPAADDFDMIIRQVFSSVQEHIPDAMVEHTPHPEVESVNPVADGVTPVADGEEPEANGSIDFNSKQNYSISEMGEIVDDHSLKGEIGDEHSLNTIVTRSGQICSIDFLEDIIEDAKNNKKTLFSAMESIMNMMSEVELQERAAEQAKEEAAKGGLDILDTVEELKQMLTHANEANDMHAGEVYGEKAILATEVRELQTRLLSLSEERDNSLAILDEMHQALESRLAKAEELKKAAEHEKLEKEESARNALAEQEIIMEKIVQESKILKQEAEENSKLRDFLMDRGRIVDTLQGEISVICQDVRLLKEKFDDRVPLSKSFSSSQTSCILASSGSSLKSMASDLVPEQVEKSKILKEGTSVDGQSHKTSPTTSIDGQSPKNTFEDESVRADRKELLDDGWDFFENDV